MNTAELLAALHILDYQTELLLDERARLLTTLYAVRQWLAANQTVRREDGWIFLAMVERTLERLTNGAE